MWQIFALIAALFWTSVSIIDKFVISHELKDKQIATVGAGLPIFLIFMIVSLIFGDITQPLSVVIFALTAGVAFAFGIWLYYAAVQRQEISRSIALISLIPVFVVLYEFFIVGIVLTGQEYLGIALLVIGAVLVSIRKSRIKTKALFASLLALATAVLYSVRNIAIKYATTGADFWSALFWIGVGGLVVILFIFAFHHPLIIRKARKGITHLIISGALNAAALIFLTIAISIGHVSLASAMIETQPLLVLIVAAIITKYHPEIIKEKVSKNILLQKVIAIVLIIIGAVLII